MLESWSVQWYVHMPNREQASERFTLDIRPAADPCCEHESFLLQGLHVRPAECKCSSKYGFVIVGEM